MQLNHNNILYSYKTKLIGLSIAAVALTLLIIHYTIAPIILVPSKNTLLNENYFHLILIIALHIIMNSKEKIEDERTILIRGKAVIVAYRFIMIMVLSSLFSSMLFDVASTYSHSSFAMKLWVYGTFLTYFVTFYSHFYFNRDVTSSNLLSFRQELRKKGYSNWHLYLYYILLGVALLIYYFF